MSSTSANPAPLTSLRPGQTAVIVASQSGDESTTLSRDDAALLRAMGLCERTHIRVCRVGEPCIVAVGGIAAERCRCGGVCRIGLAKNLADRIMVTVIA